jgi:hypothetical protein
MANHAMSHSLTSTATRHVLAQPSSFLKGTALGRATPGKQHNRATKVVMAVAPETAGGGFDSGGAMWGGRFEEKVTDLIERFGQSVSFDKIMYKQVNASRVALLIICVPS